MTTKPTDKTQPSGQQSADAGREHYDADRAITSSTQDRFGRHNFAQRVAQVITERHDPSSIVVGIYGPWGEGKTSVLNMTIEELEKHQEKIIVRRFNPWRFANEDQLLINFFTILADLLHKSLKTKGEKAAEAVKKYSGALSLISLFGYSAKDSADGLASLKELPDLSCSPG
jgi:predicted KAP-like P-loop ATPase